MADISIDLRRRIVEAYRSGKTPTYDATAEMFDVGYATVSRLLRRKRETGDVLPKPRGGNNPRRVELAWLEQHARENPDARIIDRIGPLENHSGRSVSVGAMWNSLRAIGWTHKKRHLWLANATAPMSKRNGKRS